MRITPVNYNNQTNNQASFKAELDKNSMIALTNSLRKKLAHGETNEFIRALSNMQEDISSLQFQGKTVVIMPVIPENDETAKTCFHVVSQIKDGIGSGHKKVNIFSWKPFVDCVSGSTLAKRFVEAMYSATDNIVEDSKFLESKTNDLITKVNGKN